MSSPVIPDTTGQSPGFKYRVQALKAALDQVNELKRQRRLNAPRGLMYTGEKSAADELQSARDAMARQSRLVQGGHSLATSY